MIAAMSRGQPETLLTSNFRTRPISEFDLAGIAYGTLNWNSLVALKQWHWGNSIGIGQWY